MRYATNPRTDAEVNRRQVENSVKWDEEAQRLAAEYDFDYIEGFRTHAGHRPITVVNQTLKSVDHCEFCGTAIVYVAVIGGKSKFAPETSVAPLLRQIGYDCLERILGVRLGGYSQAIRDYKEMQSDAAIESRQRRYAEKYREYIDWLLKLSPMLYENKQYNYYNTFLKDMLHILTTGQKLFTTGMEDFLKRMMIDPRFDTTNAVAIAQLQKVEITKIKALLQQVSAVDGKRIVEPRSAYSRVNSVLTYVIQFNGANRSQLDMLNDIHKDYAGKPTRVDAHPIQLKEALGAKYAN